jgi:hypothetical protein
VAKVNIVRPGEGAMIGSGQPVNAETMKPLWKNYATEISNEYAS